jgi:membrane protein YdbS with pleckstrin-like domain
MKAFTFRIWNFVFNHETSPLRNIPDVATRHYVLQCLALMWALAFSVAIGSYTVFAVSIVGHAVLISAAAITVATYSTAAIKPKMFARRSSRRQDGEHE